MRHALWGLVLLITSSPGILWACGHAMDEGLKPETQAVAVASPGPMMSAVAFLGLCAAMLLYVLSPRPKVPGEVA